MPQASSVSFFAWAVPDEPEMIAPAWPIVLPGGALAEDLRRDDADVRLAGRERAGAVRADHRHPARADVVVDAEHLVGGQALGDADDRLDARVDRLVDRVRGEARRNEDHRRVR